MSTYRAIKMATDDPTSGELARLPATARVIFGGKFTDFALDSFVYCPSCDRRTTRLYTYRRLTIDGDWVYSECCGTCKANPKFPELIV